MTDNVHVSELPPNVKTAESAPAAPAVPAPAAAAPAAGVDGKPAEAKPPTPEEQAAEAQKAKHAYLDDLARTKAAERRAKLELQAANARAAQLEAQRAADIKRAEALEEQAKRFQDPAHALAELEKLGMTPQKLAREVMEEGSPERVLAKLKAEAEAIAQAKIDAFKREMAEREQAAQAAQVERQYVDFVQKNEEKYPALTALYTPRQLLEETKALMRDPEVIRIHNEAIRSGGVGVTDEGLANFLEAQNKERYNKFVQRFGSSAAVAAVAAVSGSVGSAASGATAKSAPTVTNGAASSVGSGQRKSPKTQAELEAAILEDYNAIVAKKRAT